MDRASKRERELPGEFVSDELRADCGRFLDELRARVASRREGDAAGPDLNHDQRAAASQWSPNSRSVHSGQYKASSALVARRR
jgi:hypothetical protein